MVLKVELETELHTETGSNNSRIKANLMNGQFNPSFHLMIIAPKKQTNEIHFLYLILFTKSINFAIKFETET